MKLYGYWRSSTSYRARIALNLKGLSYSYVPVDLRTGEQRSDRFRAINPHATVPALEVDGRVLVQSLAILDALEDAHPEPSFLPPTHRQICRELYYAVATEIHAPNNLAVLKYLRETFGADQASLEAWYSTWITRTFAPVEARLAALDWAHDDLPFGQPTLFEIVLIPQVYNARKWKTDLSAFPLIEKIDAYCTRLDAFERAAPHNQPDADPAAQTG